MQDGIRRQRLTRVYRARVFVLAAFLSGVLVAGCGGSSHNPTAATTGRATTSASSASSASSTGAATSTGSSAATGGGAPTSRSTGASGGHPGALAFAKCMRANGVSGFPDPNPGGGFAFHASGSVRSSPAFKAAQAKCQTLLPSGGPLSPGPPPSAQTMAQLLRIAACMRQHGVPQFPDPRTTPPPQSGRSLLSKYRLITNYKGAILLFPATIDMQSPAYQQAQTTCGAAFLGLGSHSGH
ncbi:MAG TPA: hypothetical protein VGI50_06775 [Solirubrobacteraceae bacterium]